MPGRSVPMSSPVTASYVWSVEAALRERVGEPHQDLAAVRGDAQVGEEEAPGQDREIHRSRRPAAPHDPQHVRQLRAVEARRLDEEGRVVLEPADEPVPPQEAVVGAEERALPPAGHVRRREEARLARVVEERVHHPVAGPRRDRQLGVERVRQGLRQHRAEGVGEVELRRLEAALARDRSKDRRGGRAAGEHERERGPVRCRLRCARVKQTLSVAVGQEVLIAVMRPANPAPSSHSSTRSFSVTPGRHRQDRSRRAL
jgi:hypothetical protein